MTARQEIDFVDAIGGLAKKIELLDQKLSDLAEQQKIQGEIQVETVKLFGNFYSQHQVTSQNIEQFAADLPAKFDSGISRGIEELQKEMERKLATYVAHLNVIKQTCNLALRETPKSVGQIRCVFLVHSIPMWDALADVYAAMVADARFEPLVISLNSTPLGHGEFLGEDEVSRSLDKQGIAHLRFDMRDSFQALDILKGLRPDIIFRQQQWDTPLPPAFHTHELTFARICVIPYGMNVLSSFGGEPTGEISPLAFDQPYHRAAWKVFCETSLTQSFYRSFKHADPEKFLLSGYPKLDRLQQAKGNGKWPLPERAGGAFKVIWAPHYSIHGGVKFGVFDRIYQDMIKWAQQSPDIQFVFKPHPALFQTTLSQQDVALFRKLWLAQPNCAIEEEQYGELFDASDLMITDGVSFLTEYHLFEKPLIFYDSGHHVPFNALGRVAEKCSHRVTSFKDLRRAVLDYKAGKPWAFSEERKELMSLLQPRAERAADYILNSIASDLRP